MSEITCNHCGEHFDEEVRYCPYCSTPTPKQKDLDTAETQKKFIRYFVILVIFCIVMVLWLPREL